jgi:hypothetical protein
VAGKRIFVTHASADKPLADAVVQLLRLGTNVKQRQIFCSSVEGAGIPTGKRLLGYLRKRLRNTAFAIPLITENYLASPFCQWELGALWVLRTDTFPLVAKPVLPTSLVGPLVDTKVEYLDDAAALGRLHDRVQKHLRVPHPTTDAWRSQCDQFLAQLPARLAECAPSDRVVTQRLNGRMARFADAAPHIHKVLHSLRDAAFITILHGVDANHKHDFHDHLHASVDELEAAFRVITGTPCRICVKQTLPVKGENKVQVFDLIRSGSTQLSYTVKNPDWVHENTDFSHILDGKGNHFFSNDLPNLQSSGKYLNSHPGATYKSTIVWPIRKLVTSSIDQRVQPFLGFLCVDSEDTDVFDPVLDFSIGAGIADTLYHVLHPWLSDDAAVREES